MHLYQTPKRVHSQVNEDRIQILRERRKTLGKQEQHGRV